MQLNRPKKSTKNTTAIGNSTQCFMQSMDPFVHNNCAYPNLCAHKNTSAFSLPLIQPEK